MKQTTIATITPESTDWPQFAPAWARSALVELEAEGVPTMNRVVASIKPRLAADQPLNW